MRYEDAIPLIEIAAKSTFRQIGGDFDELLAEANLIYVKCCRQRDRRFSLERFLRFKLKRRLLTMRLRESARAHGVRRDRTPVLRRVSLPKHFDTAAPIDWTDEIREESLAVVKLALNSRPDMRPWQIRKSIKRYLQRLGWTLHQITETFKEISSAINS